MRPKTVMAVHALPRPPERSVGGDLGQRVGVRPNLAGHDQLAQRPGDLHPAHHQRLAGGEHVAEFLDLVRRQPHFRAVRQQHAVHVPARAVQRLLYLSGHLRCRFGLLAGSVRAFEQHGLMGRVIGDGHGQHHRGRMRLQAVDRHGVAGPHGKHHFRRPERRKMDFRAVVQNQPVHIAARGQRILRDLSLSLRQLRRVVGRLRLLGVGEAADPTGDQGGGEQRGFGA